MLKNDRVQSSEPFLSLRGDVAERKKDFEIPSFPSFYKSILPTADNDLVRTLWFTNHTQVDHII